MACPEPNEFLPAGIIEAANRGWQLFPAKNKDKTPLVRHWPTLATNDLAQLAAWNREFLGCNWACLTGRRSGFFALDIDGEAGEASVREWNTQGLILPETRLHKTARGAHLLFHLPLEAEIRNSTSRVGDGLDIRGEGGYILIPPSIHFSGVPYICDDELSAIADCPAWLLEKIQARSIPTPGSEPNTRPNRISAGKRTPLLFGLAGYLRARGAPIESISAALHGLNSTLDPPHKPEKLLQLVEGIKRYPHGHSEASAPDLLCLADVTARPVPWLWKNYLAYGMLAMLSGDPAAGKTFIALKIAAELSRGRIPATDDKCGPVTTLYLSHENSPEYVIRPRFDALGGDADRLHLLQGKVHGDGDDSIRSMVTLQDIDLLDSALEKTAARLVVIDPIQSYLGAQVDAHRSNETRPVMDGLIGLAERKGAAILVVRHLSKASGGRAIHRGLGSIDFTGAVRMEMLAGNAAHDPRNRALIQIKNNVGPLADSLGYEIVGDDTQVRLEWAGLSQLTAQDVLAPDSGVEVQTEIAGAVDFLRAQLSDGPKTQQELVQSGNFPSRTLQRAAKQINVKKSRDGHRGPWIWGL